MSSTEAGIEHKRIPETLAATTRIALKQRSDIPALLDGLRRLLPGEALAGPPFGVYQFVTSVTGAYDVELCFPVTREVETEQFRTRRLPALEVLALVHRGPLETVRESYGRLYGYARERGVISDEHGREVYLDWSDPLAPTIELQFIVHDWAGLLAGGLERVLGRRRAGEVLEGAGRVTVESTLEERFRWVKGALQRLERLAGEDQRYEVLSRCAHVFPPRQVEKLRAVYVEARDRTADALAAVDAVLDFMQQDPGWAETSSREGRTIRAWKKPADPDGYARATNDLERRRAACFCPIVRERMDGDMPLSFCYCGAGWYRQQWEGATGKPVRVEIVTSLLRGDERCEFAVHLADDL